MPGKFIKQKIKDLTHRIILLFEPLKSIGARGLLFSIIVLLVSCQKEEKTFQYNVLVTEQPVLVGNEKHSEIILSANVKLSNNQPVIKKGFVYGKNSKPKIGSDLEINLGREEVELKEFSGVIKRPLYPNTTYYVRSFLKTEDQITYGNQVSFEYGRSQPALLESLSPSSGSWGDTILIKGKLLGDTTENTAVYFGNYRAKCLYSRVDSAAVIVPDSLSSKQSKVSVLVYGQESENKLIFELDVPVIHSISKKEGNFPDTIVVRGENFSPFYSKINFNNQKIDPVFVSHNEIRWVVPFSHSERTKDVYVWQFNDEFLIQKDFKSLAQTFESVSKTEVWYYDTITINAKNIDFSRIENCEVLLDGEELPIYEKENGSITCQIRIGHDSRGKDVFNVKVIYYEGKYSFNRKEFEMFSFELQNRTVELEVVSEGPYHPGGRLEGKVRGYVSGTLCYMNVSNGQNGTLNFNWKELRVNPLKMRDGEFYLDFPPEMGPGTYEIWIDSYGRSSTKESITIVEP